MSKSKSKSEFNIYTIDLRVIMLIIVATGVCALLLKFLQKNSPHNVQTNGGGVVKGFLNNVKKNCTFLAWRLSLGQQIKSVWREGGPTICLFENVPDQPALQQKGEFHSDFSTSAILLIII